MLTREDLWCFVLKTGTTLFLACSVYAGKESQLSGMPVTYVRCVLIKISIYLPLCSDIAPSLQTQALICRLPPNVVFAYASVHRNSTMLWDCGSGFSLSRVAFLRFLHIVV